MKSNLHGNRFHAVDPGSALDWDHPLNKNRVFFGAVPQGIPTAGSRLLNLCNNGLHGKLTNPTPTATMWTPTPFGGGLSFVSGSSQFVDCSNNAVFDVGTNLGFSASVWLRTTAAAYAPAVAGVIGKTLQTAASGRWAILWDTPTGLVYGLFDPDGTNGIETAGLSGLNDGFWHKITMVIDRVGGTVTLYADSGMPNAQSTQSAVVVNTTSNITITNAMRIGSYDNSSSVAANFFSGMIANPSVWHRVVTLAEDALDMQLAMQGYQTPYSPLRWFSTRPYSVVAGIAFDAVSNSTFQTAQSTYSWSHTCTGSNRFLAVDVGILSAGQTVTGITYNGVALSLVSGAAISTVTSLGRVECWGLANPASGSNTIAVTLSGSSNSVGEAVSYTNVHQTSPTEAGNANQATNVGAADATVAITTVADNDWVHAAIACNDPSITANQTTRSNMTDSISVSVADEDFGPQTPAGAKTMGYTAVGAGVTWAIAGYAIRPVAASSLSTFVWFDLVSDTIVPRRPNMVCY